MQVKQFWMWREMQQRGGRSRQWLSLALISVLTVLSLQLTGCQSMATPDIPLETLKQRYTNQYSRFMDIDGTMVHYRDQGKGQPLVLVHGMVSSLHTWDGWQTYIGDQYRIIRFDVPGFGLTGPLASGEYQAETYVRIIEQLLKKLDVKEKITLAGNSLGGFIAWNYAIAHPEQVDRLILLDAPAFKQDVPLVVKMANWPGADSIGTQYSPRFLVSANLRRVFANQGMVTDELVDRYYDLTLRPGNRQAMLRVFRAMIEGAKQDSAGVEKISMPTLLMWGKEDPWVPMSIALRWLQVLPQAQYRFYDGVGHMPMEEIPMESALDAHRFIQTGSVEVRENDVR
jgi:pimeloyl-ACP methyl ester carboxylesterase